MPHEALVQQREAFTVHGGAGKGRGVPERWPSDSAKVEGRPGVAQSKPHALCC